jgi:2-polyprenyl-3-methyl-5-hydroxy-6-metoxy-1,4-benzoquinol methylase
MSPVSKLTSGERHVQRVFDYEHRRARESRLLDIEPRLVSQFLNDVQLPATWFSGKDALDAGCGTGRWSYALAELGVHVTALDLTAAGCRATRRVLEPYAAGHVVQASVGSLPLPSESFDFVMAWGVLHHTPNTRRSFERLVPLVRPGGVLYVMVYEWANRAKHLLTEVLRLVLRQFPDEQRYRLCKYLIIKNSWLAGYLHRWLKVYDGTKATGQYDLAAMQFDAYDAYSPRWNHVHTWREVREWFSDAGFVDITLTHPVRYSDPKVVRINGECGGAVHMRGTMPTRSAQQRQRSRQMAPAQAQQGAS